MIMRVSFDAIGLFRFYEIEIMYYKHMTSVVRGTTKFVNACMIIDVKKC